MKTRNYLLLAAVAIVAGLNFSLSANSKGLLSNLKLLAVEAMDDGEYNPYDPPTGKNLQTHPCVVSIDEIVAVWADGHVEIVTKYYDGLWGECPVSGPGCTPFKCTKRGIGAF